MTSEDDGAIHSVRNDNRCHNKEDGWERYYHGTNKYNHSYKSGQKLVWKLDPEKPSFIAQKLLSRFIRKVRIVNLQVLNSYLVKHIQMNVKILRNLWYNGT